MDTTAKTDSEEPSSFAIGPRRRSSATQTWAIIQYDNRKLTEIDRDLCARNKQYAALHHYDYIFLTDGFEDYPPYWAKVASVCKYLPHYQGILWLDTDAVVIDVHRKISDLFKDDESFVMCPDPPLWPSSFNAGVWAVRNTDTGRAIMQDWMVAYTGVSDQWSLKQSKWVCTGKWAGDAYEQGAFTRHILPTYLYHIAVLHWSVFQGTLATRSGAFALHFAGNKKRWRQSFINSAKQI